MARTGFWNKILHVNLTEGTTWVEEPGDEFFRKYGGGRGIIAHYILKYVPEGTDPLSPDNVLVMAPGVLTGTPVPGAGAALSRCPVTVERWFRRGRSRRVLGSRTQARGVGCARLPRRFRDSGLSFD